MVKLTMAFPSACLGRDAKVRVLLPSGRVYPASHRFPTLYLLHGLSDCADTWICRTSLERYCDDYEIAVVLPDAARSFYCDMKYGDAYYSHVDHEVPSMCEALLPLVPDAAHRYIAGNSMGGYGAYKIALKNPGKYAKAAALSGVMDVNAMIREHPEYDRDWQLCFGGTAAPASEDLLELVKGRGPLPEFYQYCGTDDFLAEGNRRFSDLCKNLGIPVTTIWEAGGVHGWPYWDSQVPALLKWLSGSAEPLCG